MLRFRTAWDDDDDDDNDDDDDDDADDEVGRYYIAFAEIETIRFVTPKYRRHRYIVDIVYCSAML